MKNLDTIVEIRFREYTENEIINESNYEAFMNMILKDKSVLGWKVVQQGDYKIEYKFIDKENNRTRQYNHALKLREKYYSYCNNEAETEDEIHNLETAAFNELIEYGFINRIDMTYIDDDTSFGVELFYEYETEFHKFANYKEIGEKCETEYYRYKSNDPN